MENWKEITKDLGNIVGGKEYYLEFEYIGNPKQVRRIKKDCGCTIPVFEDNKLKVTYKPYSLPKQHKFDSYKAKKTIQIIWKDSTVDKLTIKANVFKNEKLL